MGRSVAEVVGFRTGLVRGTSPIRVTDAEKPIPLLEELQLLGLSSESVESENRFRRPPRGHITLSDSAPPFGPSAPIEHLRLDVRRVDPHLDRLSSDTAANARTAVTELYARGVRVSRIQRAFSSSAPWGVGDGESSSRLDGASRRSTTSSPNRT